MSIFTTEFSLTKPVHFFFQKTHTKNEQIFFKEDFEIGRRLKAKRRFTGVNFYGKTMKFEPGHYYAYTEDRSVVKVEDIPFTKAEADELFTHCIKLPFVELVMNR